MSLSAEGVYQEFVRYLLSLHQVNEYLHISLDGLWMRNDITINGTLDIDNLNLLFQMQQSLTALINSDMDVTIVSDRQG